MNSGNRPISILALGCLYIVVGIGGLVARFHDLRQPDGAWIALTEILAIVAGAFMLQRQNWARWLALAWMAFHVIISFGVMRQLLMHSIIFALIAWILLRPEARRYFAS
jgi:uncharacterized membrane protein HdeD (DUF308 family)